MNKQHNTKEVTIIINGREKTVQKGKLCFDELVNLAFNNPPCNDNTIYTITYRKGPDSKREGNLDEEECVKVKKGMIFNVTPTDKS